MGKLGLFRRSFLLAVPAKSGVLPRVRPQAPTCACPFTCHSLLQFSDSINVEARLRNEISELRRVLDSSLQASYSDGGFDDASCAGRMAAS